MSGLEILTVVGAMAKLRYKARSVRKNANDSKDYVAIDDIPDFDLGLQTAYKPTGRPEIDIVLVHGLQGHPVKTWKSLNAFWPSDFLPRDIPTARILTFGYNSLVRADIPLSVRDLGYALLQALSRNRKETRAADRPLLFVSHSLGGLVVKSALVYSAALEAVDDDSFLVSRHTKACCFFGTPHSCTSKASWSQSLTQISRVLASKAARPARDYKDVLDSAADEDMLRLSSSFVHVVVHLQIKILSLIETKVTPTNRGRLLVVAERDASIGIPGEERTSLAANHTDMTKFDSQSDLGYRNLVDFISRNYSGPGARMQRVDNDIGVKPHNADSPRIQALSKSSTQSYESGQSDLIEKERMFLTNLRTDWLEDVMIPCHHKGTCEWICLTDAFKIWSRKGGKALCIHGSPGMGKTILAKYLFRRFRDANYPFEIESFDMIQTPDTPGFTPSLKSPFTSSSALAYFFDARTSGRCHGVDMIRSLLYQILSNDRKLFKYAYGNASFPEAQGNFTQLAQLLKAILSDAGLGNVHIVIDALDECDEKSQPDVMDLVVALSRSAKIRIVITSRPAPSLWSRSNHLSCIDLRQAPQHNDIDIAGYVHTEVTKLSIKKKCTKELDTAIRSCLLTQSSGSFLWVQLVLQILDQQPTTGSMRQVLENLPDSLSELFVYFLHRSSTFEGLSLLRILYYVMEAKSPLRIADLKALLALSQWPDSHSEIVRLPTMEIILENSPIDLERDLHGNLAPLLRIQEGIVTLVHQSLRDFLSQDDRVQAIFDNYPSSRKPFVMSPMSDHISRLHAIFAGACLQYILATCTASEQQEWRDDLGFFKYSCLHWAEHFRKAGYSSSEYLENLVTAFFALPPYHFERCIRHQSISLLPDLAPLSAETRLVFLFAACDLCGLFADRFGVSTNLLDLRENYNHSPLSVAAANNAASSVRWILKRYEAEGRNIGDVVICKHDYANSPLHLAIRFGHLDTAELLLKPSKLPFELSLYALAASTGNKEIFIRLWARTECLKTEEKKSLLHYAVRIGIIEIVKQLLGPESIANTIDQEGVPALHRAVETQSLPMIELLLNHGADIQALSLNDGSALHVAARTGSEQIVKMLLNYGASGLAVVDRFGQTPLHIASKKAFDHLVSILLSHGSSVNLADDDGRLAMHYAAEIGHDSILGMLLEKGSNPFAIDKKRQTALHCASEAGQETTVAILLDSGSEVDAKDHEGRTPLHKAAQSCNVNVIYMLVSAGANVQSCDRHGKTPLHVAAESGSEIILAELISLGAHVGKVDQFQCSPLHYARCSPQSSDAAIEVLLEAGASVDNQGVDTFYM